MKIIACIKYVPETTDKNDTTPTIKRNNVLGRINPLDLNAIEVAIRIKEQNQAHTIGLCMGVESAMNPIKYGLAMGLDEVVLLTDPVFAGSDTYVTSYVLSMAIRKLELADLILCGNQSTDGSTGQVPQELAIHLGLPCIINVVSFQLITEKKACCSVATEYGYCCVDVKLPAVIGLLKEINEPRVPCIKGILKAQKATVLKFNREDIIIDSKMCGLPASCTQIKAISFFNHKNKSMKNITASFVEHFDKLINNVKSSCFKPNIKPRSRQLNITNLTVVQKELWVICEIVDNQLSETAFQLLSKALSIVSPSYSVCAVLLNSVCSQLIKQLADFGVDKVYQANNINDSFLFDENRLITLINACKHHHPDIVLFENSTEGRWLSASVAASLHTGLTADCIDLKIDDQTGFLVQTRVAFSGSIIADIVCSNNRPQMATIRNNVFDAVPFPKNPAFNLYNIENASVSNNRIVPSHSITKHLLPSRLRQSDIVVCGGRGLGGKEGFEQLEILAKLIGASIGATRAAVDAKWIDYSHQIGQTGITIKPKVYIAFGVSGAIEHTIGMDRADLVVSVNIDNEAPINRIADYYIQDDCVKVIKKLIDYYKIKQKEG